MQFSFCTNQTPIALASTARLVGLVSALGASGPKVVNLFAILSHILFPRAAFLNGVWQSDEGFFWNGYSPRMLPEIWQPIF
ncbi:MAG: hypothetical protein ABSA69_08590, partial [Verrucomicrobiota bacterium]